MNAERNIKIMGIVNLTDDSYFAESRCSGVESALQRISQMVDEGVDIVDIGACSTRPGSLPVGESEEWSRLAPVLAAVREKFPDLKISIDTYLSSVVKNAYDLIGEFIVNDISAGEDDPLMLSTVAHLGLPYVAMHKRGTPMEMQSLTDYKDVVKDVLNYFKEFSLKASAAGLQNWIIDPGFGFSKTLDQNWELLKNLSAFKELRDANGRVPKLLVGISRKSMIYKLLNISPEESLPATQVAHFIAIREGADILRVHDVAAAVQTVRICSKV